MPLSLFKELGMGAPRPTTVMLQLADRSIAHPEGVIEDVLLQIEKFIFPADFIILDYEADELGIHPFEPLNRPEGPPLKPSIEKAPKLELKPLPSHLQYAYLGDSDTLPVIVSSDLSKLQEEKLMRVLREHKRALGWTMSDIKGISPAFCMHKILMEEGHKPSVEKQRRLNPIMKEVVRKEVIKWLDVGIIFPISDNKWVDKAKVEAIEKLPPPISVKGIHSFLGHAGFYHRFIKDFSKISSPLCMLLEKDVVFKFDDACLKAFEELKGRLVTAPIIIAQTFEQPFELMCDANDLAVGAVLGQRRNKIFHSIYYASNSESSSDELHLH
ncbi:uncharacterized protein LOC142163107 [Nicotiana tabacum]|uniref:Uncharacterized protein LOC142163107 n=1 Tax=Nicotiana tabacum TaxID=4097 RepID=A0AC58RUS3_TOBAC